MMSPHGAWFGPAPALVAPCDDAVGTVLLLHGQYADALANVKELCLLQGAGFNAVGVDAPEHGRRYSEDRDRRYREDNHRALEEHLETASAEISSILDALTKDGLMGPYYLVGISLGAFTGWRALPREPRIRGAALLLGSPMLSWSGKRPDIRDYAGRHILAVNAEHDEVVPLGPVAAFIGELGEEALLDVLADCPHRVPEQQWWSTWGRVVAFLLQRSRRS